MAQGIITKVFVDTSQFVKGMSTATKAASTFSKEVTVNAQTAARAQVNASVKTTEALQLQVAEYHKIAAAAATGSKEQVAAARLAEQAQHRLAVAMGETSVAAGRTGKGARGLSTELEHVTRGALSGTGVLHGFTRSLAFASGGFLAFEGVTKFLTDSINAARDAGIAQRSLAAQMKASGESFRANRAEIEKVALSYGKLGYEDDQIIASLTILERGTGKISQAFKLEGLAIDIARAKGIDLSKASEVIAKVFGRQETALRRAVPGLEKNAHGWDLLRLAQAKMAGQGAAATTVAERFSATLHNTEQIIGSALLPILNKYLTSLSAWLQRMNESGRLQRDVAKATKFLSDAMSVAKDILGTLRDAFDSLKTIVGGTKNALYALAGAFALFKFSGLIAGFARTATAITGVGAASTASAAEVGGLEAALNGVALLNPATLIAAAGVAALVAQHKVQSTILKVKADQDRALKQGDPLETALVPNLAKQIQRLKAQGENAAQIMATLRKRLSAGGTGFAKGSSVAQDLIAEAFGLANANDAKLNARIQKQMQDRAKASGAAAATGVKQGLADAVKRTPEQRNTFFDQMIQRELGAAQDVPVRQQPAYYEQIARQLQKRIAATKDITRKLNLIGQLQDVVRQGKAARNAIEQGFLDSLAFNVEKAGATTTVKDDIAALEAYNAYIDQLIKKYGRTRELLQKKFENEQQIASLQKQSAQQARDAAKAAAAARKATQVRRLQTQMDWLDLALEKAQTTKTLTDDIKVLKRQITLILQQIKLTGLTVDLARSLFQKREELKAALHPSRTGGGVSGGGGGGGGGGYSDIIPAGGGAGAVMLMPPPRRGNPTGFSTGGSTYTGDIHVYGVQNPREFEAELQKRSMQRPQTRRGPV